MQVKTGRRIQMSQIMSRQVLKSSSRQVRRDTDSRLEGCVEIRDEPAQEADGFDRQLVQLVELSLVEVPAVEADVEGGPDLARRALRERQEVFEVLVPALPLEPFGDAQHDRQGRPSDLVAEPEVFGDLARPGELVDPGGQHPSLFPGLDVLEPLNLRHPPSGSFDHTTAGTRRRPPALPDLTT